MQLSITLSKFFLSFIFWDVEPDNHCSKICFLLEYRQLRVNSLKKCVIGVSDHLTIEKILSMF